MPSKKQILIGMPKSKKNKNKTHKSKTGSQGGSSVISAGRVKSTEVIERSIPLFAARAYRKLRYSDSFQLASTSGAVTSYVFAANGLYDPNVTGTGHQPMGFDDMMLFYNHYTVLRCTIQVICKAASASKMTVGLKMDAAPTPITDINRIVEMGGMVIEYLDFSTTFGATKRLEATLDIARIQGVSRSALTADTSLRGTSVANPSEMSYFHVQSWDAAAQTGTVNVDAILDFEVVFTEPRDASTSIALRAEQMLSRRLASVTMGDRKS